MMCMGLPVLIITSNKLYVYLVFQNGMEKWFCMPEMYVFGGWWWMVLFSICMYINRTTYGLETKSVYDCMYMSNGVWMKKTKSVSVGMMMVILYQMMVGGCYFILFYFDQTRIVVLWLSFGNVKWKNVRSVTEHKITLLSNRELRHTIIMSRNWFTLTKIK